jgi:hypothetical protein
MPRGSDPNTNPKGWAKGGMINGKQYDRGHLVAKRFGGSGSVKGNLAIILRSVNQGIMKTYENAVARAVASGEVIWYRVTPVYRDPSHIPYEISIQATGSRGFYLNETIPNR